MSIEKDKNVLSLGRPSGTIEIKPHPEEVIEVAPEILALMNARLKDESFVDVYGEEDRVSQEFLIRKEIDKLKKVFGSGDQVLARYQSIKGIKETRQELQFEGVDCELVGIFAAKKMDGAFVDESDLFLSLLGGKALTGKATRFQRGLDVVEGEPDLKELLIALKEQYLGENIEPLQITKEVMQLQETIKELMKSDHAVGRMNQLLWVFYGERA